MSKVFAFTLLAFGLVGCTQHDAGDRDRENCAKVRIGEPRSQVLSIMGEPTFARHTQSGEEALLYNTPSMPDLPIFTADRPVEIVLISGPSGPVVTQVMCSGED